MGNLLGSEPLTPTVSEDEWVEESVDTSDSKMEESLEEFVCRLESLEYNMFCSPSIFLASCFETISDIVLSRYLHGCFRNKDR